MFAGVRSVIKDIGTDDCEDISAYPVTFFLIWACLQVTKKSVGNRRCVDSCAVRRLRLGIGRPSDKSLVQQYVLGE